MCVAEVFALRVGPAEAFWQLPVGAGQGAGFFRPRWCESVQVSSRRVQRAEATGEGRFGGFSFAPRRLVVRLPGVAQNVGEGSLTPGPRIACLLDGWQCRHFALKLGVSLPRHPRKCVAVPETQLGSFPSDRSHLGRAIECVPSFCTPLPLHGLLVPHVGEPQEPRGLEAQGELSPGRIAARGGGAVERVGGGGDVPLEACQHRGGKGASLPAWLAVHSGQGVLLAKLVAQGRGLSEFGADRGEKQSLIASPDDARAAARVEQAESLELASWLGREHQGVGVRGARARALGHAGAFEHVPERTEGGSVSVGGLAERLHARVEVVGSAGHVGVVWRWAIEFGASEGETVDGGPRCGARLLTTARAGWQGQKEGQDPAHAGECSTGRGFRSHLADFALRAGRSDLMQREHIDDSEGCRGRTTAGTRDGRAANLSRDLLGG